MNICWVTRFPLSERAGRAYSEHAAVRMRMLLPAEAVRALGHSTRIVSIEKHELQEAGLLAAAECRVAVIDQVYPMGGDSLDQIGAATLDLNDRLQRLGVKTAADIHDNHFDRPGRGEFFHRLVQVVDAVVVNTRGMMDIVSGHTRRPVFVIGDPYEGPHGEPLFAPAARRGWRRGPVRWLLSWSKAPRLKLAWFGHPSNLAALYDLMPELLPLAKRCPMQLTVVSARGFGVEESCEVFNHHHGRHCRMGFVSWSPDNNSRVLSECDLAVIPADIKDASKLAKSANRLTETLRAGRFSIVNPLPAYQEFADGAWIGVNIAQGIEWALDHPAEAGERIRAGQRIVERDFSPAAIAKQWERMFVGLAG